MADNTPTSATVLRSLPSQYEGWVLSAACGPCQMVRLLPVGRLARRDVKIGQALNRLRCRTCGAEPHSIKLSDGMPGTARVVREVVLIG
jgi:hypothetical protein